MADSRRPATGPIILNHLLQLREEVRALHAAHDRREQQFRNLSQQIDRFLAAEIDLTGTLVQVRSVVGGTRDSIVQLRAAALDLKRAIDGALDLALGDPSDPAREREQAA